MKWRILNPVLITPLLIIVAATVPLMLIYIFSDLPPSLGDRENAIEGMFSMIKSYFYPYDITLCSAGNTNPGCVINNTPYIILQFIWVLSFIASAQPFKSKLRVYGSIVGVIDVIVWTLFLVGITFVLGLRH